MAVKLRKPLRALESDELIVVTNSNNPTKQRTTNKEERQMRDGLRSVFGFICELLQITRRLLWGSKSGCARIGCGLDGQHDKPKFTAGPASVTASCWALRFF